MRVGRRFDQVMEGASRKDNPVSLAINEPNSINAFSIRQFYGRLSASCLLAKASVKNLDTLDSGVD
jgi:hypothetical protein